MSVEAPNAGDEPGRRAWCQPFGNETADETFQIFTSQDVERTTLFLGIACETLQVPRVALDGVGGQPALDPQVREIRVDAGCR